MTILPRQTVRAAVDRALSENPLAELQDAAEIAAERLGLPVEAVLEALTDGVIVDLALAKVRRETPALLAELDAFIDQET